MPEKNTMTVAAFLDSLKNTVWRIKKANKWYELRVANTPFDLYYTDEEGVLFGIKKAKINFYIFNENTNVVADWAATLLNNFYFGDEGFSNLSKNDVYFSPFGVTLDCLFIEYLLNEGDFEIFDSNGNKVKKSPEGAIF